MGEVVGMQVGTPRWAGMGCSHHGASGDLLWCWIVYSTGEAPFHLSCRIPAWSSIGQLVTLRLGRMDVESQDTGAAVPGILWKL